MAEATPAGESGGNEALNFGVDPAAMALGLGSASRAEADAFLRKQSALIDEQRHHLRAQFRQFSWSLWEVRLSVLLRAVTILVGLAIAAAIGFMVWAATEADGLVIDAFSVPPDLAARGLTGEVVATRFLDQFQTMQAATVSERPADTYQNNWGSELKVEIPDTGLTFGEVGQLLRDRFGHVSHVTGEVVRTAAGIAVTARLGGTPPKTFAGAESDFDDLARHAAEAVYRASQPYRYAEYVFGQGRIDEGFAVISDLAANGPPGERAWAYYQWGYEDLNVHGDVKASLRHCRKALAVGGAATESVQICLAGGEYWTGHDEKVLTISTELEKNAQIRQPGLTDQYFESNRIISIAFLESITGDLKQSVQDWIKTEAAPDFLGSAKLAPALAATDDARDHDPAAAARIMAELDHASDTDFLKEDAIYAFSALPAYWIAAERGDWRAAAGDARAADDWLAARQAKEPLLGRVRPVWIEPLQALAMANSGDVTGAQKLIAATPADCYLCLRIRGRIAALEGDAAAADRWFGEAVRQAPSPPFAYAEWGAVKLQRGDAAGAMTEFKTSNQKGPHFADPLEGWGEALMAKNQSHLALAKFSEAAKYAPNWGRLHLKWGEALIYAGKSDEARVQFARAAALDLTPSEKAELSRHP